MKNLILVLFAIVAFSFGINAQDLSFKTFNRTLEPKGELVVVEKDGDNEDYYYQEWGEYSLTQWEFRYKSSEKMVYKVFEEKVFYDELELERADIKKETRSYDVWIPIKKDNYTIFNVDYEKDEYTHRTSPYIVLKAKTKKEGDDLLAKLKEKAFDMSLDLDAKVERVSLSESMIYNAEYPDGITSKEFRAIRDAKSSAGDTAENESKDADDEEKPTTTKNTNSSNNSTPKAKTEISLRILNRSDGEIDISYESRGAGGSKTQTSINPRSSKSVKMKVGGRVFGANGAVLLTVTADMEDTEQVIFK